jgi:hypothetical protein
MENTFLLERRGKMRIFLVVLLFLSLGGNAWGTTFKGKVIDADTKQPIEGAVVVASWLEETTTPGATHTRLKDVKETLTNKKGEWMIEGLKGREGGNITAIFTLLTGTYYTRTPEFIVFKPGYCSWPAGFTIDACRAKIKPGGNDKVAEGENVELQKLTKREDRLSTLPSPVAGENALKKQREFIRLINEEHRNLELKEIHY